MKIKVKTARVIWNPGDKYIHGNHEANHQTKNAAK